MPFLVTPPALSALKLALDRRASKDAQVYRLQMDSQGGLRFRLDNAKNDDARISHEQQTVVVMQPEIAHTLNGKVMDINQEGTFVVYDDERAQ